MATSDVRHFNPKPLLLLPPAYIAKHIIIWSGLSLRAAGISCPGFNPSQNLVLPQSTPWWGSLRGRKGLDSMKGPLGKNQNIPELSTVFWSQIQNTAVYQLLWLKLTLSQPNHYTLSFRGSSSISLISREGKPEIYSLWKCNVSYF